MDWLCGLSNIKRINNFDRYSDIASLLLNIFKTIDVYIEPPDTMGLDFYSKITIHDDNLNNFIEKWIKLKDIHKDKTIAASKILLHTASYLYSVLIIFLSIISAPADFHHIRISRQ